MSVIRYPGEPAKGKKGRLVASLSFYNGHTNEQTAFGKAGLHDFERPSS